MKKLKFSAEDFKFVTMQDSESSVSQYGPSDKQAGRIAEQANELFDEWYRLNIEGAPTVQGHLDKADGWEMWELPGSDDTHTAKLVDIKEIK